MKAFPIIYFVLFSCCAFAQEKENFEAIHQVLNKHFSQHPSENIFVQTDRDVYRAGDVVWFTGFVCKPALSEPGSVSDNLIVSLFDETGELVNEDKYKMADGLCAGDFDLSEDAEPGRYVLVAYSGSTQQRNEVFMKIIDIDQFNSKSLLVSDESRPKTLLAGETNELIFTVSEMDGKPFIGKLNYELLNGPVVVADGKAKPDEKGLLKLNVNLPRNTFDGSLKLILADGRAEIFSACYHSENEKIQMQFDAEGGNFVPELNRKIVFRPVNKLGQPVNVDVAVIEKGSGKEMIRTKTLTPGYGIWAMTAETGKRYQLKITAGPGKGQLFDLPEFKTGGFALSVGRFDENFIYCNLRYPGHERAKVTLAAFRGAQLFWGTDMTVDGNLNLKIPKDDFPGGLCQFIVFDKNKKPLAERLIYVEKNSELTVSAELARTEVPLNTPVGLKLNLMGSDGNPAAGIAAISVCPKVLIADDSPSFANWLKVNGWLEHPVKQLSWLGDNGAVNESSLNDLLIGNRYKNTTWETIQASQTTTKEAEGISRARLEEELPAAVKAFLQGHEPDQKPRFTADFYKANPDLFQKLKPRRVLISPTNSYKQYLTSGSSLLDVIKMIKPYTLDGDKIIFPGGQNSLMMQDGALIVIDGQRMGTSASVLNSLSPYDVESIDVSTRPIDIQQYTGLNSVGLIDIKTKRGERVVNTNTAPAKPYKGGNRVPRDFTETMLSRDQTKGETLFWAPAVAVDTEYSRDLPGSTVSGDFVVRILAVDNTGELTSKELGLEIE